MSKDRTRARELARTSLERGDAVGWFEVLYREAAGKVDKIPWADLKPNPHLVSWLETTHAEGHGRRALVVGCGLGDDAECLAAWGYLVTAFDVSAEAIRWCRERWPETKVHYVAADLFVATPAWRAAFDFVFEANTLQVLPQDLRPAAMRTLVSYVAAGGWLLAIARGREPADDPGAMPWPLTKEELCEFVRSGLREQSFEDFSDQESPPVRRFRALYCNAAD